MIHSRCYDTLHYTCTHNLWMVKTRVRYVLEESAKRIAM